MAGKGVTTVRPISANSALYYVGLQPTNLKDTNRYFVDPNFTYNPATGTLQIGQLKYPTTAASTNSLPRSAATYVDTAITQSIAQGNLTDLVPFRVTITPSSVNSQIAIFVNWFGEHQSTSSWDTVYGLKRNGSPIGRPVNPGNRTSGIGMAANSYYTASANDASTPEALSFHYVDNPATDQAVTYQLTVLSGTAALNLYTNRTVADTDQTTDIERGTSSIIAIEIAQ